MCVIPQDDERQMGKRHEIEPPGSLKAIVKQADLPPEEFLELL
jgi:hypothetical protein